MLLVNETFGNRITAFDLTEDGRLTNRRTWAEFGPLPTQRELDKALPKLSVAPDGCCLDADGALWIADGLGARLLRVTEGGKIVDEVAPGTSVFACALGGSDGTTLFACAAPDFDEVAFRLLQQNLPRYIVAARRRIKTMPSRTSCAGVASRTSAIAAIPVPQ